MLKLAARLTTFFLFVGASARGFELLHVLENVEGYNKPNRVSWILADELPEGVSVTAAYAFVLSDGKFLVGEHRERGWDIPGGHVEAYDASPAATAARETFEETGVRIKNLRLYAYQKIELLGPKPENYKYPHPVSYQAIYAAEIESVEPFIEEEDMIGRDFWTCGQVLKGIKWAQRYPKLFLRADGVPTAIDP